MLWPTNTVGWLPPSVPGAVARANGQEPHGVLRCCGTGHLHPLIRKNRAASRLVLVPANDVGSLLKVDPHDLPLDHVPRPLATHPVADLELRLQSDLLHPCPHRVAYGL